MAHDTLCISESLTTSRRMLAFHLGTDPIGPGGATDGPLSKSRRVSVVWQSGSDHVPVLTVILAFPVAVSQF